MSTKILITSASAQEKAGIKALLHACDLPSSDLSASHLKHFFVINNAGIIVGCIGLEICGGFALLRSLALSQHLRGQGLGIQLVEHIQEYACSQQINSIYLLTTTADHFFSKIGYHPIPRDCAPAPLQQTAEFQSICPESAVCMFKELK